MKVIDFTNDHCIVDLVDTQVAMQYLKSKEASLQNLLELHPSTYSHKIADKIIYRTLKVLALSASGKRHKLEIERIVEHKNGYVSHYTTVFSIENQLRKLVSEKNIILGLAIHYNAFLIDSQKIVEKIFVPLWSNNEFECETLLS